QRCYRQVARELARFAVEMEEHGTQLANSNWQLVEPIYGTRSILQTSIRQRQTEGPVILSRGQDCVAQSLPCAKSKGTLACAELSFLEQASTGRRPPPHHANTGRAGDPGAGATLAQTGFRGSSLHSKRSPAVC